MKHTQHRRSSINRRCRVCVFPANYYGRYACWLPPYRPNWDTKI